ncbi:MAG: tRNA (guanosine(37)-N1)-methyltransferase TrmD [Ignavibacteriales bacterium]|nr:tRNA (guanosine(37)-N1)-methyltransferase TrmD [Ignavibacteriales bacterium]
MRIDVITGFPQLLRSPLSASIIRQAKKKKLVSIRIHDLRKYTHDKHKTIDDTPYGGGAGMVLKPEPIFECIETLQEKRNYDEVIYVTADGEKFNQKIANQLSMKTNLIFLCGHYKGIDHRVREKLITKEISIGDYVLTGGELAALVIIDALVRLIPGVLGDSESMLTDSFQGDLLDCPSYTKPAEYRGMKVPEVLLSGDHKSIEKWRYEQRVRHTNDRRKSLLL